MINHNDNNDNNNDNNKERIKKQTNKQTNKQTINNTQATNNGLPSMMQGSELGQTYKQTNN